MNFTTTRESAPAQQPKAAAEKHYRVQTDEHAGTSVTLAQAREQGEPGDVFGLTRPEGSGRKGFAMKRVLGADGTFGAVNGGELVGEWTDAQLGRLVYVGKRVEVSGKAAAKQQPKAKAKARARKAQAAKQPAKQAKSERTPEQHAATLRMLEGKRDKLSGDKAAKKAAQASIDRYREKHGL